MSKHSTTTTATRAVANTAAGLGSIVFWTLRGTGITPAALRGLLTSEGITTTVPDVEAVPALRRAAREWSQGRGHADRYRAEIAGEDNGALRIGILRREKPAVGEVRWVQIDACEWDVAVGGWRLAPMSEAGRAFVAFADHARAHLDHQWIRPNLIQAELAKLDSARLRDGVYYVPAVYHADLIRLKRVVDQIGSSDLAAISISPADAASQKSVAAAAEASVKDDLAVLVERIQAWTESTRRVSTTSSTAVLSELADLKNRADLYADALQVGLGDLTTAIDAARQEAMRVIGVQGADGTARAKAGPNAERVAAMQKLYAENRVEGGRARLDRAAILDAGFSESFVNYASNWTPTHPGGAIVDAAGLRIVSKECESWKSEDGNARYQRVVSIVVEPKDAEPAPVGVDPVDPVDVAAKFDLKGDPGSDEALMDTEAALAKDEDALGDIDATRAVDADADNDRAATAEADLREEFANMTPAQVRERYIEITGKTGKMAKDKYIDAIVAYLQRTNQLTARAA